jgi:hypothetical protein
MMILTDDENRKQIWSILRNEQYPKFTRRAEKDHKKTQ